MKKPFSISLARSSADISTLRGVSMNTLSAIRCMPPSSAYVRPLAKSIRRLDRSSFCVLEVEDHRDRVLEAVGHLLGVVERFGHHQMDAHLAVAAAAADGAQHCGGPAAGFVLGEDLVVLVVAPPRRQAAHIGTLSVVILQLGLMRNVVVVAVVVILLGEAEVDESTVP